MAIRLTSFGGLWIADSGRELEPLLRQRARAALFVFLAVEGEASRASLGALFWPDSEEGKARHALRQGLYQLRRTLGDGWIESRGHQVRVTSAVRTDTHAFSAALDREDFEVASRLYGGPFLDGVHLLDRVEWERWLDSRRARYARDFRRASRGWLENRQLAGDLMGVVEAAERWVAPDPFDDEAQHALIQALADAGERADALQQFEVYQRLLEPEGLRPLDSTVQLATRLRSDPGPVAVVLDPGGPSALPGPEPEDQGLEGAVRGRAAGAGRPDPGLLVRPVGFVVALLALAAVLVSAFHVASGDRGPDPSLSPPSIAVLPFTVRGGEEGDDDLAEAMVNLLGTALDGAASIRPADTRAILAAHAQAGGSPVDLETADRLAERLGSDLFVLGEVVRGGDRLQIDAGVYQAASPTLEPVAQASVTGEVHGLFDLVDGLAARLLAALDDPQSGRLLRTAAVTTESLPAFMAYLEGERLMREGAFERAEEAYQEAVRNDSTFALAHYRLAAARNWAPLPGEEEARRAAARHADRLSPRDRDLLEAYEAWRAGRVRDAERTYRAIVARYPDDLEAWTELGEILFHHGPSKGRPLAESEGAWRRVLDLEPRNLAAVLHLGRIAAPDRRTSALDSLLAPFDPEERWADRRLLEVVLLRALAAEDSATLAALVEEIGPWEDWALWRISAWVTAFAPDPGSLGALIQGLIRDHWSPAVQADVHWFTSILLLAEGRVGEAEAARAHAVAAEASVPLDARRGAYDLVTAWHAATLPLPWPDSLLIQARRAAADAPVPPFEAGRVFQNELGLGRSIRVAPLRQYTLGILSLSLEDPSGVAAAADSLRALASADDATPLTRDLDRGLRARMAWEDGEAQAALDLLDALELGESQGDVAAVPFASRVNERFLRAEILAALGRDDEALRWLESVGQAAVGEVPLRAPVHLEMARIHQRLGDEVRAADHYARFVELWESSVTFGPLVEEARRRWRDLSSEI